MICRCSYLLDATEQLEALLKENNISYEIIPSQFNYCRGFAFDVYQGTEEYDAVEEYIERVGRKPEDSPTCFRTYTPKELDEADFLVLRPWRHCIEPVNDKEAYEYRCEYVSKNGKYRYHGHKRQVGRIKIGKLPKFSKTTAFYSIYDGFGEIFADSRILEIARQNHFVGMEFLPLLKRNGEPIDNLFQIYSKNIIRNEFIRTDEYIGKGLDIKICPVCGERSFCVDSGFILSLKLRAKDLLSDFYMTESIFSDGRIYMISGRFYRAIKAKKLTHSLTAEPVLFLE